LAGLNNILAPSVSVPVSPNGHQVQLFYASPLTNKLLKGSATTPAGQDSRAAAILAFFNSYSKCIRFRSSFWSQKYIP